MALLKRFLNYTEIRTKITSTFTFAMTIAFLLYRGEAIYWRATLVFFAAMFLFDLATTAINNYIDTKANGQGLDFNRKAALLIIYLLVGSSAFLGLYLVYLTDIVVLAAGGVCFLCGVLYTYGPVPISRQPLGEMFSGFFYGVMIPFILMYINMPAGTFLTYHLSFETVGVEFKVLPIITLLLFSVIPFCTTANIMLANNICDVEKDILVKRHTLPYYIGKRAVSLFAALYYLTYAALLLMVLCRILPPICLLSFLSLLPVRRNIRIFRQRQVKEETFICSIRNFILIMGTNTLMIFLSFLLY